MDFKAKIVTLGLIAHTLFTIGCGSNGSSFSILPDSDTFQQAEGSVNNKIDLLWVIDNSGSMQPFQNSMISNYNSFMNQFVAKNFDFHLSVTTTDAYLAGSRWRNDPNRAKFKDGRGTNHTGVFTILPTTPNLINVFATNANQGVNGSGDERAFSSFKAALDSPLNAGFLRSDSFLGIIILSDEDDFSGPNRNEYDTDHSYSHPGLETVASYVTYLDDLTNTTGANRRYSVSAIAALAAPCTDTHWKGQRYIQLANATNGELGDICSGNYAAVLDAIQNRILELGTAFRLSRKPIVSTIVVRINGAGVPQDAANGWTYDEPTNSIVFHGTAIPASGSTIVVAFDPEGLDI